MSDYENDFDVEKKPLHSNIIEDSDEEETLNFKGSKLPELCKENSLPIVPLTIEDINTWERNLTTERVYDIKRDSKPADFYKTMAPFHSDKKQDHDDLIRSHGMMGLMPMYSAPIQEEYRVLRWFFEDVFMNNEPICLAPALTRPYSCFFQDIDLKQTKPITFEFSLKLCQVICYTISCFYSELKDQPYIPLEPEWKNDEGWWVGAGEGVGRLRFLIASSGFKSVTNRHGESQYALGLHIYSVGRLMMTSEQAQLMRLAEIENCELVFGKRFKEEGFNSWLDVIDANVYKGYGGTRIIGSCKDCDKCSEVQKVYNLKEELELMRKMETQRFAIKDAKKVVIKTKNGRCDQCQGWKKYMERKAYQAKLVMNHKGQIDTELNYLLEDPWQAIMATSIRIRIQSGVETYWKCLPGYRFEMLQEPVKAKKLSTMDSTVSVGEEARNIYLSLDLNFSELRHRYGRTDKETMAVLYLIQHRNNGFICNGENPYSQIKVENLTRFSQTKYYLNILKNCENWNYCLRCKLSGVANFHHQNRIYFEITPKYIIQKSYSDNNECTNSKDKAKIDISEELKEVLFGRTKKVQKGIVYKPQPLKENDYAKVSSSNLLEFDCLNNWVEKKRKEIDPKTFRSQKLEKALSVCKDINPLLKLAKRPSSEYDSILNKKKQKVDNGHFPIDSDGIQWGTYTS